MFSIVPFVLTNAVLQVNGIEVFMGNQLCQDGLNIPDFQKLSMSVSSSIDDSSQNVRNP